MSFEERVQAFKDNKLAVQIATSNYYGKAGEEDTLNTIIYNYYNEYVYDDFSTYPTTTFSTYKGNNTDYLVLEIAHDGTMYDDTIILLFKNTDDALVLIDEYEEWNRVHINIYDGIVIEEHCYEGIASRTMVKYLDENEICHQLYTLDSFLMNYYPYLSDELKALKNKIGELGLSNDFLDMLFVRTLSVNNCYYVQFEIEDLYDETSANTYLEYKKEFDILKEIYQSSDMPPSYIFCDPDVDIMNYARDYLTALGLTI